MNDLNNKNECTKYVIAQEYDKEDWNKIATEESNIIDLTNNGLLEEELKKIEKKYPNKILVIDFDYIMYSCIRIYEKFVNEKENPTVIWNNIEYELGSDFLFYDSKALLSITKLIRRCIDNDSLFIRTDNHNEIIKIIKHKRDTNSFNDDISLTSISYHHNLGYTKEDIQDAIDFDSYHESNWLAYLYLNKYIQDCTWISAPNSNMFDVNRFNDIKKQTIADLKLQEDNIESNFDFVFFNKCENYVPYKFLHLYDLICEALNAQSVKAIYLEENEDKK